MRALRITWRLAGLLALLAATTSIATGASRINTNGGEAAIGGYDPVAYFTDSKPVEGDPRYSHQWQGAQWHFANRDHLKRFKADPERYAPRYGGWCAYAVAQGDTVKIDPAAWTIRDDQLYLNYDAAISERWRAKADTYIEQANQKWPEVLE